MSLFKNQNFITQIAKQHGINHLPLGVGALIQASVENQTRKLLEAAFKTMTLSRREQLNVSDIETALVIINCRQISLTPAEEKYEKLESGYLRSDKVFTDCELFIKEELKDINHIFDKPQIKGRWVLFNDIVPRLPENHHIKNFKEIQELQQNEFKERNKKFNVIRDQPLGLITVEEQEYFRLVTTELEQGIVPAFLKGNPLKLMPMFMSYLRSCDVTDTSVMFLLELLKNVQVQENIEQYLYPILVILMAYEGIYSWKVGMDIAQLIKRWRNKYPNIMDVASLNDYGCYSVKIKKLALEQELELDLSINKSSVGKDIENGVPMAREFSSLLNKSYELKATLSESMTMEESREIFMTL